MGDSPNGYIIAVDGGGSTCRVCVADAMGNVLGRAVGQPANIATDFEKSRENILETIGQAYNEAGLKSDRSAGDVAYLGLAGAGIGDLASRLEQSLKFNRVKVVTDREPTVHGALGGEDGTVALFGTGSFYSCRRGGELRNVGGWGFRLCDDGGGAFLGINLLRRVVQAYDGLIAHSPLTRDILDRFGGTPHGIVTFAQTASPMEFGEFAPDFVAAFKNADPVVIDLVNGAVDRLHRTLEVLDARSSGALYLLGGLGPFYQSQLNAEYQKLCKTPVGDALAGCILLAQAELMEVEE